MKNLSIMLLTILLSFGCAHTAKQKRPDEAEIKQIKLKNYTIGNTETVNVGDSLVRVKNYTALEVVSSMKATNNFSLTGGILDAAVNVSGRKGQKFDILGEVNAYGEKIKGISIPGSHYVFGIYQDGNKQGSGCLLHNKREITKTG